MLIAIPRHWLSRDYRILGAMEQPVAEIKFSVRRNGGEVVLGGAVFRIFRRGFKQQFVFTGPDGTQAASVTKPGILRSALEIKYGTQQYRLKPMSAWSQKQGLFFENRFVGSIRREKGFKRRVKIEFTDEVPLQLQIFAVWTTLLLWKY